MDDFYSIKHVVRHDTINGSRASLHAYGPHVEINRNRTVLSIMENGLPVPIPAALSSMLKTTTENGNIGHFAAKPFRIPTRLNSAGERGNIHNNYMVRKPPQTVQRPCGPPPVDDRKQLPSYARDATSEIISMYETTSQKSSGSQRIFEEPDYRSYSMTQTSNSLYDLSNHRSYTSLRSQPELNMVQRPRSPFPYPARLKRLGFRPSSPILPNGGRFEFNKQARMERVPNTDPAASLILCENAKCLSSSQETSASARRKEPKSFIIDSEASSLIKPLASNVSSAPQLYVPIREMIGGSLQDWANRPESRLEKTSPARSTNCLGSNTNPYNPRTPVLAIVAPSRPHTPSPLYYDYTEEFGIEDIYLRQGDVLENFPALQPPSDEATHEGRITSPELDERFPSLSSVSATSSDPQDLKSVPIANNLHLSDDDYKLNLDDDHNERSTNVTQDILPLYLDRHSYRGTVVSSEQVPPPVISPIKNTSDGNLILARDSKIYVLDKFVEGASEISGLGMTSENSRNDAIGADSEDDMPSSFRMSAYLPIFPRPPHRYNCAYLEDAPATGGQWEPIVPSGSPKSAQGLETDILEPTKGYLEDTFQSSTLTRSSTPPPGCSNKGALNTHLQHSASSQRGRIRSSRFYSIDYGLTDLAQLITNFEAVDGSFSSHSAQTGPPKANSELSGRTLSSPESLRILSDSPALPMSENTRWVPLLESRAFPNKNQSERNLKASILESENARKLEVSNKHIDAYDRRPDTGDGRHQLTTFIRPLVGQSLSHGDLPMLAPQPVSPARTLRLKDSVPQLMKALPPVPRDSSSTASITCQSKSSGQLLATSPEQRIPQEGNGLSDRRPDLLSHAGLDSTTVPKPVSSIHYPNQGFATPPTQDLRSDTFNCQRPISPVSTRAWKSEAGHSWFGVHKSLRFPSLDARRSRTSKRPRFNLRVTRASNLSSEATVFGTKTSDQIQTSNLDLKDPTDSLHSPPSLSGMLRRVGEQFGPRKQNAAMEPILGRSARPPFTVLTSTQVNVSYGQDPGFAMPLPSPTVIYPSSPAEDRSFFSDDSSQTPDHHSLRNRISNLRGRIPSTYMSRPPVLTTRNMGLREHDVSLAPSGNQPKFHLGGTDEDEYGMPVTELPHYGLKSKISLWFKETRAAIERNRTIRNSDGVRCMPVYR